MPKAKSYKGVRMTRKMSKPSQPHRKEDGRPKGTRKKFKFEQTPLGFMLKHEIPAAYTVIMRMTPKGLFPEPSIRTIEIVCNSSTDPSLAKPKFQRYFEQYKRDGICCRRPKLMTPERESFYREVNKRKISKYAKANSQEIEKERKLLRQERDKAGI